MCIPDGGFISLEVSHEVIVHSRVTGLKAALVSSMVPMKVCLLVGVLDLCSPNDADGNILLTLAIGQVVHGLCLSPTRIGWGLVLLKLQPDAHHHRGTAQQQHEDKHHPGTHGHPGEGPALALHVPVNEVHHHGALWWLREQELAVGATIALGTLTQVALAPLVAGASVVAG